MNIKNIVLATIIFSGVFVSCNEDMIDTYSEKDALNFPKTSFMGNTFKYDSLEFSSIFNSGVDQIEYRIPVYLTGKISGGDRRYKVSINSTETRGIVQGTHFTMETEQIFKADRYLDSLILTLNVAAIKNEQVEGRVYIQLIPNENFTVGLEAYQSIVLTVSGKGLSAQPGFWNTNYLSDYGGNYSHIKAEKFIELNGIPNATWRADNKAIVYAYAKKTYEWFENNEVYDNGERVRFIGTIIF